MNLLDIIMANYGKGEKVKMHFVSGIDKWLNANVSHEALIAIPALFVALLVPIAFFLMERDDLYGFDKNVILEKIIWAKVSIPLVFVTSILLLFNVSILSVLISAVLMAVVAVVLWRVYRWMTSIELNKFQTTYKQELRLQFIDSIKDITQKVDIWAMILNDENLLEKNQRGLVERFLKTVRHMRGGDSNISKTNLLMLMARNVEKIDFADPKSYENLVAYAIEYFQQRRDTRAKNQQKTKDEDRDPYPPYSQRELALNLLKIALSGNNNSLYDFLYFTSIKKYIAQDDVDEAGFAGDFLPDYINVVEENDSYDIRSLWQELPGWVVTQKLLQKDETKAGAFALLKAYHGSIMQSARLDTNLSSRQARVIDGITENLFPKINLIFWFDIVTFYTSSWGTDEGEDSMHGRIRSYVTRTRKFGLFQSLGISDWIEDEQARNESYVLKSQGQDEETMFILGLVYGWLRNPDEIKKMLDQIAIIEKEKLFDPKSHEALRLESLKNRFEKFQAYTAKMIAEEDKKKCKKK